MDLGFSGAYHLWISTQFRDGTSLACPNPWTGIIYNGTPHTPLDARAEATGPQRARLHWKPDIFGVWHYQILVYKTDVGWVETRGPGGAALWHFVDYPGNIYSPGTANFREGWAELALPAAGSYWLFIRAAGWKPPHPAGEFAKAFVTVKA